MDEGMSWKYRAVVGASSLKVESCSAEFMYAVCTRKRRNNKIQQVSDTVRMAHMGDAQVRNLR